ncbi:MAG: hypothetical protein FWC41_08385 [Firmicutes bacterium]|nr:hypothetical protein [Bacillota bacterium]
MKRSIRVSRKFFRHFWTREKTRELLLDPKQNFWTEENVDQELDYIYSAPIEDLNQEYQQKIVLGKDGFKQYESREDDDYGSFNQLDDINILINAIMNQIKDGKLPIQKARKVFLKNVPEEAFRNYIDKNIQKDLYFMVNEIVQFIYHPTESQLQVDFKQEE